MSTDWSRDATPAQTRNRAARSAPADNAILALAVGGVRAIPDQSVVHSAISGDPELPDNRAHCDVFGPKNMETRARYRLIYRLVIPLDVGADRDSRSNADAPARR